MKSLKVLIPELNENQWKLLKEWIEVEVIGENEEVPSMEEYVEWRGGGLNVEDDDNPEIATQAQNDLKDQQRTQLNKLVGDI